MRKLIALALILCWLIAPAPAVADDLAAVKNFTYWSYYCNYLSYVEGGGSYSSWACAYYAWAYAEAALIAETPEDTQAWLDLVTLYGETALFFATTNWMVNPSEATFDAMWFAYYSMVAVSGPG